MLFIAMMLAAARAALRAAALSLGTNSAKTARVTVRSRLASAQAMKVPARCCSLRPVSCASDDRFSFRSLAYSGKAFLRASMLMGTSFKEFSNGALIPEGMRDPPNGLRRGSGRGLDDLFALLPVAGAEFVG